MKVPFVFKLFFYSEIFQVVFRCGFVPVVILATIECVRNAKRSTAYGARDG